MPTVTADMWTCVSMIWWVWNAVLDLHKSRTGHSYRKSNSGDDDGTDIHTWSGLQSPDWVGCRPENGTRQDPDLGVVQQCLQMFSSASCGTRSFKMLRRWRVRKIDARQMSIDQAFGRYLYIFEIIFKHKICLQLCYNLMGCFVCVCALFNPSMFWVYFMILIIFLVRR